jgi:TPR repeat protein
MNMLGVFHSKGKGGLPVDEKRAYALFQEAADKGLARAKRNMATYYARGLAGLPLDGEMAYMLLNEV